MKCNKCGCTCQSERKRNEGPSWNERMWLLSIFVTFLVIFAAMAFGG